jgi:hypothetical protein
MNTGDFHNVVAMFDNQSTLLKLKGKTFSDKWFEIRSQSTAWGSTNFQSVIDLLVNTRKDHPEMDLNNFPTTLLVVSDMQFNPTNSWSYKADKLIEQTNYETAMKKLRTVFPEEFVKEFKIIWWHCTNRSTSDYPSTMEDAGTYMFSGFDGSILSILLGTEPSSTNEKKTPTMEEIVDTALNQEVLTLVV